MRSDDDPPHVPQRGPESVEDMVERRWRPFASHQQRRRSDHFGVGARKRHRFSLTVAHASSGGLEGLLFAAALGVLGDRRARRPVPIA
jgi:hypothetical protein